MSSVVKVKEVRRDQNRLGAGKHLLFTYLEMEHLFEAFHFEFSSFVAVQAIVDFLKLDVVKFTSVVTGTSKLLELVVVKNAISINVELPVGNMQTGGGNYFDLDSVGLASLREMEINT
jgi:hypothetical protein